jgi:diguanylate cyclase (GGDEF)-like protein
MNCVLADQFANISIRKKLLLLMMAVCVLVLTTATCIGIIRESNDIIKEQKQDLDSLSDILGKNVSAALAFNDPLSASSTISALSVKTNILAAYILDANNAVFSTYQTKDREIAHLPFEKIAAGASPEQLKAALEQAERKSKQLIQLNSYRTLITPIILDGQTIGHVVLYSDLSALQHRLTSTLLTTVFILIGTGVLAYFLSLRLQNIISVPIYTLADSMRQVSDKKDFSIRVSKSANDEIGHLYDGFNEMLQEIEERNILLQQRQEHLQQLAHFDTLTRLPNRTLYYDRLRQAIHLAQRTGQAVAVMFIDLDQFKDINDTLGHAIGDQLLRQAAGRMALILRDCDTVARLGGDEFTIFIQDVKTAANACLVAQKILDLFEIPYNLGDKTIYITCSIGITLFPNDGDSVDGLLMNADIAMYHAKADGKNGFRVYSQEMNKQTSERVALQHDLRKALDLDQLVLLYQPKFDAITEKICGFEALIRWHHPERGFISPVRFIPLAEETGLIMPITEWVLQTACKQARLWYDSGFTSLSMAVNLSALSLKRNNAVTMVQLALEESGLPPACLELELTESMLIENDHIVGDTLQIFNVAGISIALDDFGTGYSSLSYLHRFPINVLKIDRSFVWNMNRSANDLAMVTAIIAMARSLNMKVVAEGVETQEQLESLKKCGCNIIQGYYFSKPISAKEVSALLRTD